MGRGGGGGGRSGGGGGGGGGVGRAVTSLRRTSSSAVRNDFSRGTSVEVRFGSQTLTYQATGGVEQIGNDYYPRLRLLRTNDFGRQTRGSVTNISSEAGFWGALQMTSGRISIRTGGR